MRARMFAVVCWCAAALTGGVSFFLLLEGTSHAAGCRTAVCQRIEVIRQRNLARRYTFPDPNYRVAINLYLNDLDRRMVYFEGIRRYYPTQESWDRVVEQTRQNYLTALESLCRFGTLTEDDTDRATDTPTPADAAEEASRTTESGTANNATGTSCPTAAASERGGATGTCASNQTAASGTSGTTGQVAVVRTATGSTAASANTSVSMGTNASGQTAATAPTKRIIATLPNGHRYAWEFYPGSAGQPARIVAEGRLP